MYEQMAIDALQPRYNICPVAGSTLGYRHTEETRLRFGERPVSRGNLGKRHSAETRARISNAKRGRPGNRKGSVMSDETRAKLSAALKGRRNTPEQIALQKASFAATIEARKAGR